MLNTASKVICGKIFKRPTSIFRTFAIRSLKEKKLATNSLVQKICVHIEHINFHPVSVQMEPNTYNIPNMKNLDRYTKSVPGSCLKPQPDSCLEWLYYFSLCSNDQYDIEFKPGLEYILCGGIKLMNMEELYMASKYISKINCINSYKSIAILRNFILTLCENKMKEAHLPERTKLMCISYIYLGNVIKHKEIYSEFIKSHINQDVVNEDQIIQLIYYLGLVKNSSQNSKAHMLLRLLMTRFHPLKNLSAVNVGLICSSLYRTKYLIAADFEKYLTNTMLSLLMENSSIMNEMQQFSLVSMAKVLYSINSYDKQLVQSLKIFLLKNKLTEPVVVCHLMSYYSNCKYYDEELMQWYAAYMVNALNDKMCRLRAKDVNRALVTFAILEKKFSNKLSDSISTYLEKLCQANYVTQTKSKLNDMLFSLVIMDIVPQNVCRIVFSPSCIAALAAENTRQLSRIRTMYEVVGSRCGFDLPYHPPAKGIKRPMFLELKYRPGVRAIQEAISWLEGNVRIEVPLRLRYLIDSINICSLTIDDKPFKPLSSNSSLPTIDKITSLLQQLSGHKICLDINDVNNSLRNVDRAIGIEEMKRGILINRGWRVCVLNEKAILSAGDPPSLLLLILNHLSNSL